MVTKTCRWILASGKACERPTEYTLQRQEDGSRRRRYETFCPLHKAQAQAQEYSEDEDQV